MSQGTTIDFSKYEQKAPAQSIDFSKYEQPAATEQPGLLRRAGQALGIPTSMEELASTPTIKGVPIPKYSGLGAAVSYGQNVYDKAKELLQHPELGPALRAVISLTPQGGLQQSFAEDVANKNYSGAAGTALGVAAQVALPKVMESFSETGSIPNRAIRTGFKTATDMASDIPIVRQALKLGKNWEATAPPAKPTPPVNAPLANTTAPQASVLSSIPVKTPAKVGPPTTTLGDLNKVAMPKAADVEAAAQQAVGYQPPKPGVPIGQPTLPPGHTPVESTAVRSYRYDPDARTLEIHPTTGTTTYKYGDVTPEQASDFQNAKSYGTAWQQIRQSSSPLIQKRINGKWQNVTVPKPAQQAPQPAASLGDLTGIGQQSVVAANIMKVVGREGPGGLQVGMARLMKAPELQGFSREQIEAAARGLRDSNKILAPEKEADVHGPAGIQYLALKKH